MALVPDVRVLLEHVYPFPPFIVVPSGGGHVVHRLTALSVEEMVTFINHFCLCADSGLTCKPRAVSSF